MQSKIDSTSFSNPLALEAYDLNECMYQAMLNDLLRFNFTHVQCNELILKKNRSFYLTTSKHSAQLLQAPYALVPNSIFKLASKNSLEAFVTTFPSLKALGFATPLLVTIGSKYSGGEKLHSIIKNKALLNKGLTTNDVYEIVKHGGGTQALDILHDYFDELHHKGLEKQDIINIARNKKSAYALIFLIQHLDTLIKRHDIKTIISLLYKENGHIQAERVSKLKLQNSDLLNACTRSQRNDKKMKINDENPVQNISSILSSNQPPMFFQNKNEHIKENDLQSKLTPTALLTEKQDVAEILLCFKKSTDSHLNEERNNEISTNTRC